MHRRCLDPSQQLVGVDRSKGPWESSDGLLAHVTSSAERTRNLTHLLLRLCTSTWPLNDDILFGLCISGERKSDTGESGALQVLLAGSSTSFSQS